MKIHLGRLSDTVSQEDFLDFVRSLDAVESAEPVQLCDIDVSSRTPFTVEHMSFYRPTGVLVRGLDSTEVIVLFQDSDDWNRHRFGYDPFSESNEAGDPIVLMYQSLALSRERRHGRWIEDTKSAHLGGFLMECLTTHFR